MNIYFLENIFILSIGFLQIINAKINLDLSEETNSFLFTNETLKKEKYKQNKTDIDLIKNISSIKSKLEYNIKYNKIDFPIKAKYIKKFDLYDISGLRKNL